MNKINVPFTTDTKGYNTEQVDKYIQTISEEYEILTQKYNELSDEHKKCSSRSAPNMEAIAKALVGAEERAIQVVADAEREAARIIQTANMEVEKIYEAKANLINEVGNLTNEVNKVVAKYK